MQLGIKQAASADMQIFSEYRGYVIILVVSYHASQSMQDEVKIAGYRPRQVSIDGITVFLSKSRLNY